MLKFSKEQRSFTARKIAGVGVLSALAIALVMLIRLPIIPTASYLEYDPADIPIFLATFMYGPVTGLIMTVVVSVLQGLTVSAASGPIGILMHVIATGSFVTVAGLIYKYIRNMKGAVLALSMGSITMIVMMVLFNIIMTPFFLGIPRQAVYSMILPIILPFNLIKTVINSAFTLLLYKKVKLLLKKMLNDKDMKV